MGWTMGKFRYGLGIRLDLGIINYDHAIVVTEEKILIPCKCRMVYSIANGMKTIIYLIMVQKKYIQSLMLEGHSRKNKMY